jgi:ParB family chromosome partitioning protein
VQRVAEFHESYPLGGLRGAIYNPRRIAQETLIALRHSITRLGICKPIIATTGGTVLAGHQRSKALMAAGITHGPVVLLPQVSAESEVRFNQLHNGTDFDSGDEAVRIPASGVRGYEETAVLAGNTRAKLAPVRSQIAGLLLKYGNWGGCVATQSGDVIHAAQYALACYTVGLPARVYRIPDEMESEARELLGRQYGVFSYDHLERRTYVQTFAQMFRLRGNEGGPSKSSLYENVVLPQLRPGERVLRLRLRTGRLREGPEGSRGEDPRDRVLFPQGEPDRRCRGA